jgi:hypothetical protein
VLGKCVRAQNERHGQSLSEGHLAAATEVWFRVLQQRLDFLAHLVHKLLGEVFLLLAICLQDLEPVASDLGEPGVDEEVDACAGQRVLGVASTWPEVRRVSIGQKRSDDGRFCDDLAVEVDGRDEAALNNLSEVFLHVW